MWVNTTSDSESHLRQKLRSFFEHLVLHEQKSGVLEKDITAAFFL